jgi:hypothetical protein
MWRKYISPLKYFGEIGRKIEILKNPGSRLKLQGMGCEKNFVSCFIFEDDFGFEPGTKDIKTHVSAT